MRFDILLNQLLRIDLLVLGVGQKLRQSLLPNRDDIGGKSLCALGDAACGPVSSAVKKFRDELMYHVEHKSCLPGTKRYRRLDMPVGAH